VAEAPGAAPQPATIRLATPADVPALAPLLDAYRQFYEQTAAPAQARAYLQGRLERGESVVLLAAPPAAGSAAPPVGFCQLYPTFCSVALAPIYCLYDLFVVPSARRGGVARALMLAAERHAAGTGAVRLDLSTARTNRAAQALYESLGWVRDDVFHVYSRPLQIELR
jgi:ribosomal protein S18 acetylase RimI-like enzyme